MKMPTDTELYDMFTRAVILRPKVKSTGGPVRVRSRRSPDGILCLWDDCDKLGDAHIDIRIPHETPRWDGERVIYVYCSENHRLMSARKYFRPILGLLQRNGYRL